MAHRIFVYGTLKQGYPNFHVNRGRRVPGSFTTAVPYPLYILGATHLPWLVQQPGAGLAVTGELYEVDDDGLAAMDVLEQIDEPGWYRRERIQVVPAGGGDAIETWVYFGTPGRVATEPLHAGPLAEYTVDLSRSYRHG